MMMARNVSLVCIAFFLLDSSTSPVAVPAADSELEVQYLPQFADGAGYSTTWTFVGYHNGVSEIDIEFFDSTYHRLSVDTDRGTGSTVHLSLNGYGSTTLRTTGSGGTLKTGWVRLNSSPPVGVTETYRYAGSGGSSSQATVFSSNAVGSATLMVADARSTAIALLNPPLATSNVTFQVRDADGSLVGASSRMVLDAGNQVALFVNQIPGFENITALNGSIEITASTPFHLTSLVFDGRGFATMPALAGRSVSSDARGLLLNRFGQLLTEAKAVGDELLPPPAEVAATFSDFLKQPQTGLMRLLPREIYDGHLSIRGGGAYYSFARLTHEYGYGSDLELSSGAFTVGFAGADFGFLTNLGNVPIDGLTLDSPGVQYLAAFTTPNPIAEARAQQDRASAGFQSGGYYYRDRQSAISSTTYALRSICYRSSDVLVVFRLVRIDPDGSTIILWKVLKSFGIPDLLY